MPALMNKIPARSFYAPELEVQPLEFYQIAKRGSRGLQGLLLASNWHPNKKSIMRKKKQRLQFLSIPWCFQICKFRPLRSIPIHIRNSFLSALDSVLAAECMKYVLKLSRASSAMQWRGGGWWVKRTLCLLEKESLGGESIAAIAGECLSRDS